jgi:hypothetical protein
MVVVGAMVGALPHLLPDPDFHREADADTGRAERVTRPPDWPALPFAAKRISNDTIVLSTCGGQCLS